MIAVWIGIALMMGGVGGVAVAARHSHLQGQQLDFIQTLGNEADLNVLKS